MHLLNLLIVLIILVASWLCCPSIPPKGHSVPENLFAEEVYRKSEPFCSFSSEAHNHTLSLLKVLNAITASQFFRYYKTHSYKECPYWAVNLICSSSDNACSIWKCEQESIPTALRMSYDMSDIEIPSSFISQSVPHPSNADAWGQWLGLEMEDDTEKDEAEYVDLIQNPEGNTGYSGPRASSIWKAIFQENCLPFETKGTCQTYKFPRILFSGLYTSIFLHVVTNFYRDTELTSPNRIAGLYNNPNLSFLPNCEMFLSRIVSKPENIQNLHVVYQFVLKSLQLAQNSFLDNLSSYNSGNDFSETEDDKNLKLYLKRLFEEDSVALNCFNEEKLRKNAPSNASDEVLFLLSNVTRLMDCVECQKCRIWGKLETKGLATALRIFFGRNDKSLDRAEKVTLINLARQLSFALNSFYHLSTICRDEASFPTE